MKNPKMAMHAEVRAKHKDGTWHTLEVVGRNLLDDPVVAGIVANFRDITERKQMEEALRESEFVATATIEGMSDGVLLVGMDGKVSYVNKAFERIFGHKAEELIGTSAREHPIYRNSKDRDKAREALQKVITAGYAAPLDMMAITKDGKDVPMSFTASVIKDSQGNPKTLVAVLRDVSERKEAEEALLREKAFTDKLINAQIDTVFLFEPTTGKPIRWNKGFAEMSGYNDEEITGMKAPDDFYSEDDLNKAKETIDKIFAEGHGSVELTLITKQGGHIPFEYVATIVETEDRENLFLSIGRDITERKKAEEAVRESEEKLRFYLDNSPDGIYINDMKANFLYGNRAAERLVGYPREELLGKSFLELGILPEEYWFKAAQLLERNFVGEPTGPDEFELIRKDGARVFVEISTYPVGEGDKMEVIGIARDITERKRMEEQLRLAGRLAAVGELSAGVAHELNNPLAAIQGYAQFLTMNKELEESVKKDVDIIYREAQRASKITQNLLSFARQHEPSKSYISLNDVLEKTLELRTHQMKVNNIELVKELAPNLPNTMADFYKMQEVFLNVVVNSEQAMTDAHGRGKLEVRAKKMDGVILVSFTDDGPGISEENMKRIFDPFFTTKEVGKGTGLGLSICFGIVEAHGGRLYARSKLGEGTTFFVEIPIVAEGQQG